MKNGLGTFPAVLIYPSNFTETVEYFSNNKLVKMIFNAVATALAVTSVVTRISLTSSFSSSLIQQSADVTQRSKSRLPVSLLSTIDSSVLDYRAVNKLSFRELQKACKDRSLTAAGPTAVLRIRLLESSGIAPREEKPEVDNEVRVTKN